jgi:hypothetical protein
VHSVLVILNTSLFPGGEVAVHVPAWVGELVFAAALGASLA